MPARRVSRSAIIIPVATTRSSTRAIFTNLKKITELRQYAKGHSDEEQQCEHGTFIDCFEFHYFPFVFSALLV
jgi:hypothetical protein